MDDERREYLKKAATCEIQLYGPDVSYHGEIEASEVLRWLAIEAKLVEVEARLRATLRILRDVY